MKTPFIKLPSEVVRNVFEDLQVDCYEFSIWMMLLAYQNNKIGDKNWKKSFPTIDLMEMKLGIHRTTIMRKIDSLKEKGLIKRIQKITVSTGFTRNFYEVMSPVEALNSLDQLKLKTERNLRQYKKQQNVLRNAKDILDE